MVQTLQDYLEPGQPIFVINEDGLLFPYQLQERDLSGESSAINHKTPELFRSCLERIPGEPFNPRDFNRTSRDYISHLDMTRDLSERFTTSTQRQIYPIIRVAAEVAREIHGEPVPEERKWGNMNDEEREKELSSLPPERKRNYAFITLRDIMLAAQSDAIGQRQRAGVSSRTVCLYELIFNVDGYPRINVYLKKPEPSGEEVIREEDNLI